MKRRDFLRGVLALLAGSAIPVQRQIEAQSAGSLWVYDCESIMLPPSAKFAGTTSGRSSSTAQPNTAAGPRNLPQPTTVVCFGEMAMRSVGAVEVS